MRWSDHARCLTNVCMSLSLLVSDGCRWPLDALPQKKGCAITASCCPTNCLRWMSEGSLTLLFDCKLTMMVCSNAFFRARRTYVQSSNRNVSDIDKPFLRQVSMFLV